MAARTTVLFVFAFCSLAFSTTPRDLSLNLFRRITGVPIQLSDPRLSQMEKFIAEGNFKAAANIATEDSNFYRLTLKQWATKLSNREESPFPSLNDFSAMVIGVTRDGKDARLLLVGNFGYQADGITDLPKRDLGNNNHYDFLENKRVDLKKELKLVSPQWPGFKSSAGLLTSRAWGSAHYRDGTNRRAVEFSIQEFLCTNINQWKEAGLSDHRVRRDVDRRPGKNYDNYKNQCRTCHATMDAMGGAFARFDFKGERLVDFGGGVADKMNRNGTNYPDGYVTVDDSWETPNTPNHQQLFGWRGQTSGLGIKEFGKLLANSDRFKSCMAEKAFKEMCGRDANGAEREKDIPAIAQKFEEGGYHLRSLFEDVAVLPSCLGQGDAPTEAGVNNFRQVYESLISQTGVDPLQKPDIEKYFQEAVTRLPKSGTVEEMNSTSLLAITALSGMFCKAWISDEAKAAAGERKTHTEVNFDAKEMSDAEIQKMANRYALNFWQREATAEELKVLLELGKEFRDLKTDKPLSIADQLTGLCTAMASSLESMSR